MLKSFCRKSTEMLDNSIFSTHNPQVINIFHPYTVENGSTHQKIHFSALLPIFQLGARFYPFLRSSRLCRCFSRILLRNFYELFRFLAIFFVCICPLERGDCLLFGLCDLSLSAYVPLPVDLGLFFASFLIYSERLS